MKFHEATDIFPLMNEDEFERLCDDVRKNGLREAIWTYQGEIIDGRNRYNACEKENVAKQFREWDGTGSLLAFVVSLNLHRRQLNESQRAMVAAKIANLREGRPKENRDCETAQIYAVSQSAAGEMFNVSRGSVQSAARVIESGVSRLNEMTETGEISVSTAATIAALPKGKQIKLVRRGREKLIEYASNIRVEKKLKKAKTTNDLCLLCNHDLEVTDENFKAFMHAAARRVSKINARYIYSMLEEMEETEVSDEVREYYAVILKGIDTGFQDFEQLQRYTRIPRDLLKKELQHLVDGGTIDTIQQGGKTEAARGQRKLLYRRCDKTPVADPTYHDDVIEAESYFHS